MYNVIMFNVIMFNVVMFIVWGLMVEVNGCD